LMSHHNANFECTRMLTRSTTMPLMSDRKIIFKFYLKIFYKNY
jgi:hypothetical protein